MSKGLLRRKAIDDMDNLELRALAYFTKRLMKDINVPWKRITLMNMSVDTRDAGGVMSTSMIRVPGMRYGALFIHQDTDTPDLYSVSHYELGLWISYAASLHEAIYICGALEFGGVPWDLIEDLAGWQRIKATKWVEEALTQAKRAFLQAEINEAVPHNHTPHERLKHLVDQADAIRAAMNITGPNKIIYLDGVDGGDTTIVVTANGQGGADYEEFGDYNAGPNNRHQLECISFEMEAAAIAHAEARVERAQRGITEPEYTVPA